MALGQGRILFPPTIDTVLIGFQQQQSSMMNTPRICCSAD
jgi:hypothetical protein